MSRLKLLPQLLLLLLIGCSSATLNWQADSGGINGPGGIGGTGLYDGAKPGSGGIGGTGRTVEEGIGGTGRVAGGGSQTGGSGLGGTGIVGTITAFGSIWVNDAHVHFNEQTPITINQAPATSGELQLGQVVAVNSEQDGDAYQAKSIDIIHEVVGPIHGISLDDRQLEILKQKVLIEDDTVIFNTLAQSEFSAEQLISGAFIEVSGLRQDDGDIVASRIDIIDAPEQIQLVGDLSRSDDGVWQINEQTIEIDKLLVPEDFDKRMLVSGYLQGDLLIAQSVGLDSIEVVLEDVSELIYEGYYFEDEMEGIVTIGGMEFAIEEAIEFSEEHDFNEPLRISAQLSEEGIYHAEDLLIELENEDHYIDLLHEDELDHEEFEHEDYDHEEYDPEEWEDEEYFDEEEHEEEWQDEEYFEDDEHDDEHHEDEHYEEDYHNDEHFEDEHLEEDFHEDEFFEDEHFEEEFHEDEFHDEEFIPEEFGEEEF